MFLIIIYYIYLFLLLSVEFFFFVRECSNLRNVALYMIEDIFNII